MNELELQKFTLADPNNKVEEIDFLQELVDHDFMADDDTDFDKYFSVLENLERDNDEFKNNEASYIIEDLGPKFLDPDFLTELNRLQDNMKAFMRKHSAETDLIKGMTEPDKDKIFAIGKFLNRNFVQKVNELTFTFPLSREEYKFIHTAFWSKLTYDGTEVFNLIELKSYLDQWDETFKSLPKQAEEMYVTIDIRNVVMMYHFLSKHKVKGIEKEFYYFVQVLGKIADTNKLFNAYNVVKERMNSEFFVWSGSITPMNQPDPEVEAEAETAK